MDNLNPPTPPPPPPPSQVPPHIPSPAPPPPPFTHLPLGENPEDRTPIPNALTTIEAVLRAPRRILYQLRQPNPGSLIGTMFFIAILCSLLYGVVVGTFSGGQQYWIAPVKISGGMLFSALICVPSLYIFACLSGSQARLVEIIGMVAGLLMLTTILLIGFAPVALLFSTSTNSTNWMAALHLLFWLIATIFGLRFVESGFSHSQARSHAGFNTWVVIFVLVALQMTTALRPIVGTTTDGFLPKDKKFFLGYWGECLSHDTKDIAR